MNFVRTLGKKTLLKLGLNETYTLLRESLMNVKLEITLTQRHIRACRKIPHILQSAKPLNLNLGSGDELKSGWINVDVFNSVAELALDLRRSLPFPNESVDAIYSSHVLEHFSFPHPLSSILRECFRVLKVGGIFRAAVPDFGRALKLYAQDNEEEFYAQKFWPSPLVWNWTTGPIDELNHLVYMGNQHKFMFDRQNITDHLLGAGFTTVRICDFDPTFDLEDRKHQSLYVEAIKKTVQPFYDTISYSLEQNNAAAYDTLWANEAASRVYAGPARRLLWAKIAHFVVQDSGFVLDIGCGNGSLLALLIQKSGQKAENLYGLDYSAEAIKQAKSRIPAANFSQGDAQNLDFPANYFEIALACETLEHVENPELVLQEIYRVLKPKGCLIITIPNGDLDTWRGHSHFWNEVKFREILKSYSITHFETLEQGATLLFIAEKIDE